jgi:hypothetical protein
MKKIISLCSFSFVLILVLFQFSLSSCEKDTITETDTLVVTKTDTLIIKDTAVTLQLLSANSWKIQEIRGVVGNTITYYLRGGSSNTDNYDNEYITFNSNKTGIYFDFNGGTHQITWDFSNTNNTKLSFVVSNPAPLTAQTVVWENLRYKNGALLFDQYWSYNNVNTHAQVVRVPK